MKNISLPAILMLAVAFILVVFPQQAQAATQLDYITILKEVPSLGDKADHLPKFINFQGDPYTMGLFDATVNDLQITGYIQDNKVATLCIQPGHPPVEHDKILTALVSIYGQPTSCRPQDLYGWQFTRNNLSYYLQYSVQSGIISGNWGNLDMEQARKK